LLVPVADGRPRPAMDSLTCAPREGSLDALAARFASQRGGAGRRRADADEARARGRSYLLGTPGRQILPSTGAWAAGAARRATIPSTREDCTLPRSILRPPLGPAGSSPDGPPPR
jgi:hypothetical protein